jgi:hypothetical protein
MSPLILSATQVITTTAPEVAVTSLSTAEIAKNFFTGLWMDPLNNVVAIGYLGVPSLGAIAGILFLLKKGYDKAYPSE